MHPWSQKQTDSRVQITSEPADRLWPSALCIFYKKPFSASLLPARSLCQSQAKVLHFITLAVCWEQLRSHVAWSLLGPRAVSTISVRYSACKKLSSWLRSFPRPKAALSSDSTKSLRCFSAVLTVTSFAKKAGVRKSNFSPYPNLCLTFASRSMCIPDCLGLAQGICDGILNTSLRGCLPCTGCPGGWQQLPWKELITVVQVGEGLVQGCTCTNKGPWVQKEASFLHQFPHCLRHWWQLAKNVKTVHFTPDSLHLGDLMVPEMPPAPWEDS